MKKYLTLVLALMLALGLLPAAGAGAETLTMLQRLPATYVVEGNPVIKAWGDMLSVDIEIEAPPISSYNDRRNVILASGDLPDIIYVNDMGSMYTQWSRDGLFLDLTPYFNPEDMPHAYAVLTQEELFSVQVQLEDGSTGLFSLPRVQTKPWDCYLYRGDWLEKLGLSVPTTPAEFAKVMEAFATQDPDGNGLNDTYGWSYEPNASEYRSMICAFGIRPTEVPDENGNYQLIYAQPAYMEFMDWLRDMYAVGAIDPEFYLGETNANQFVSGKIGTNYTAVIEHLITYAAKEEFKAAFPDGYIVAGPPLHAEGETQANIYYNPQIWGNYAISADCENIELAIKFLDAGYSDEVNELLMFGLEGVTYTTFDRERRFATKTEEQKLNADKYVASYATINYQTEDKGLLIANGSTEEEIAAFNEAYDRIGQQTNRISYLAGTACPGYGDVDTKIVESGIHDQWRELRTKYIIGEASRDEVVDFINSKMVPVYEPLIALYEGYNDGQGFNK